MFPSNGVITVFAALGDDTRLRIVSRLCSEGPMTITRLTGGTSISRQAIAKHLVLLANAGIVVGQHRGREHVWQLVPGRLNEARSYLDAISVQWDEAILRLKALVEEGLGGSVSLP